MLTLGRISLLVFLVAAVSAPTFAASKRYTTLFQEHMDGKKQPTSSAENRLIGLMIKGGVTFIDEAQSRKIRSVTDAGQLMAGKVSTVITSLDADVIVAGICRATRIKSAILGPDTYRYDASCQSKVIAVATGQILGTYQVRGEAIAFVASQAAAKAANQAATKLAKLILAARSAGASRIELTVTGIPNITAGDAILQTVKRIPGAKAAAMLQSGRGVTKIEIKLGNTTVREVALALDGVKGLGVSVIGYSDRAIKAQYAPEAAMQVPVVLTRLAQKGKSKADAWQAKALPGIVGAALSNLQFVQLTKGTETAPLGKPKKWAAKLRQLGVDPMTTLVLTGTYRRTGASVNVTIRLVIGASGATIAAASKTCPRTDLATCVGQLGTEMASGLMKNLLAKRHLFKGRVELEPSMARAPAKGGEAAKPLELGELELDNIFPARLSAYTNKPVGTLTVINRGKKKLKQMMVTTDLPGFVAAPLDTKLADLAPGASLVVPIKVVLDRSNLVKHDENVPALMSITLRYKDGDFQISEKRTQAIVVYDRNTLSWKDAESVSAFVTPRTATVQRLAKHISAARGGAIKQHPLSLAASLFVGMGLQKLSYQVDPVNPYGADTLDYVQYPEQTLTTRAGDCDDLAVLYAALAEALGKRMLLVTTPSHVFVAVHTGVPAAGSSAISLDPGHLLTHEGLAWIPLETTLIGKSVHAAWMAAAKELGRFKGEPGKVQVIDLRAAWSRYPPASLIASAPTVTVADPESLQRAIEREVELLTKSRTKQLQTALAKVERALAKKPKDGKLLLKKGFLLALSDQTDKALEVFKAVTSHKVLAAAAHNNVGNVHMSKGRVPQARKAYALAIGKKAKDARMLINAALAAHAAVDEDAFGDLILEALEAGAEDLVVALSKAGVTTHAGTRGADAGGIASRDLTASIAKAYLKRKKKLPKAFKRGATRASDASAKPTPLGSYLFWL